MLCLLFPQYQGFSVTVSPDFCLIWGTCEFMWKGYGLVRVVVGLARGKLGAEKRSMGEGGKSPLIVLIKC